MAREGLPDGDENMTRIPKDENGMTYVVITEGDGPVEEGELLVCAEVPGGHVREIGYPSRKPIKWSCEYEQFGSVLEAVDFIEKEVKFVPRSWVPEP